jgi:hypothetical protein
MRARRFASLFERYLFFRSLRTQGGSFDSTYASLALNSRLRTRNRFTRAHVTNNRLAFLSSPR